MRLGSWKLAGWVVSLSLIAATQAGAQVTSVSVSIDANIDGRSWAVVRDQSLHWQHFDYDRPGRWAGAQLPTYITVMHDDVTVIPRYQWQPVWINGGNTSEPVSLGDVPFGSACDPGVLTITQARGPVQILGQPSAWNNWTTIIEFNDNTPLGASWYRVALTWDVPTCPADLNCDKVLNSQDFFYFLSGFFGGAPIADYNRDGQISSQDFFDFLTAFFDGCE